MKRNLPRSQHIETLKNFTVAFLPLVVASNECHECLKHVVNNEEKDPNLLIKLAGRKLQLGSSHENYLK